MKKIVNAITAAMIVMVLLLSCKKEDKDEALINQTTQKLLGKWTFLNSTSNEHRSGTDNVKVTPGQQGDYIEFMSGGQGVVRLLGASDAAKYSVTKDNKVVFDQVDEFELKTLTESDLVLFRKVVYSSANYSEETYTLKK